MEQTYFPLYDEDLNNKVAKLVGDDKQLVFDRERRIYLAEKNEAGDVLSFTPTEHMKEELVTLLTSHA